MIANAEIQQIVVLIDMLSNGFKFRTTRWSWLNGNNIYLYYAFGQSLVGSNNIPCTAR